MAVNVTITDPAFRSIQPSNIGFHIWRIEKLELVPVPRESYGKFFNGDSYIVYSSTPYGEPGGVDTKLKPAPGKRLEQHIHFWLGEDSSQDEAAVAAYKTVELDDHLGGSPIQHREVQGHESKRFLAYFKGGVRILQGGVATGLNHYVEDKTPKLYIVKGKRQPIIRQLATVSWGQMNDGDAFVMDVREAEMIFVWTGKQSNRLERLQASKFAQKLKDEYGEGEIIIIEDGYENNLSEQERHVFDQLLPIGQKQVRPASEAESDEKEDVRTRKEIKLYRCSDEEGTLKVSEVKNGPLMQSDLESKDSFIVDNGECGIWVWVGKKASQNERTEAMRNAQGFIKKKGYKAHTPVTRVVDGGEPCEFKSLFKTWKDKEQAVGMGKTYTGNRGIAKIVQTKFDATTLHENPKMAAESRMVDDGNGAKEIFRVDKFDLLQVPEEEEGKFYSGDCYVILYAYSSGARDNYLIYYWLGAHSSQDEQGTAALKAVELDQRLGGSPVQVRVVQGKEPPHFLAMFQGRFIIFQGGLASSFDGEIKNNTVGSTYLLQCHGRSELSTKAVQVDLSASSLNTNDCFVLVSPQQTYVWMGKGSTGDEREMAKRIAHNSDRDPEVVYEGQEKADFWKLLGGKAPYMDERVLKDVDTDFNARLFHGSNATGNFKMEEIMNFGQADLVPEDVMLLDVGDTLFVWLGRDSNDSERQACIASAKEYLATDPTDRDHDIPIMVVKQGFEPPSFTGFFGYWDDELFTQEETNNPTSEQHNGFDNHVVIIDKNTGDEMKFRTYDIKTLLDTDKLPQGVDPSKRELHLSDRDFEQVFGVSREDFDELPQWKKIAHKKRVGLF